MISYDRLWHTMKAKGVTQYTLIKKYGISPGQITRLKRNESVSTHTIEIFCRILNCQVEDVMEYIPGTQELQQNKSENSSSAPDRCFLTEKPPSA